uniref:Thiol:disulfi de interchange protein n=1 Tax=Scinaia undulata TaxID=1884664 RepID=A0A1G4NXD6_9FLOR|nr:Thiol:disulfi de interchange protein [Scinaia undulata]SCW23295.1 Thiol:disulfi de interchange protein [Scinaia undulata]
MLNINNAELILYSVQQNINRMLIDNINHITISNICIIFTGGILTSINPCVFSSMPVSMAYINKQKNRAINTTVFLVGIVTSIILIGVSAIMLKQSHFHLLSSIPFLWSLIVAAVGLNLLGVIKITISFPDQILKRKERTVESLVQTYFMGCGIGMSISPCSAPILITLLTWISSSQQFNTGYYLLLIYVIGYIAPLMISLQSFERLQNTDIFNDIWSKFMPASGCLIVSLGTFSLFHELFLYL